MSPASTTLKRYAAGSRTASARWTSWSPTQAAASPRPRRWKTSPRPDGGPASTATCWPLKSFLPGMKARRRGAIITVASSAGRQPDARAPIPYGAAKAAIALMTQDVAAQAGPHGIRVNCIAPETILTERNQERIPPAQQAAMAEHHPLKRLGTTQDVASAAVFLASDDAAWITGTILDVAGGAVMT